MRCQVCCYSFLQGTQNSFPFHFDSLVDQSLKIPPQISARHWFLFPLCQYEGTYIYVVTILHYVPFDAYIHPSILELQLLTSVDPTAAQIPLCRTMPYLEHNIPLYGEYVLWWTLHHCYPVGCIEIAPLVAHIFHRFPSLHFFYILLWAKETHLVCKVNSSTD